MKLCFETSTYGGCTPARFTINGKPANHRDFVAGCDKKPDKAPDYGCGNMQCTMKPAKAEILKKYGITREEYREIAAKLKKELSVGACDMCN